MAEQAFLEVGQQITVSDQPAEVTYVEVETRELEPKDGYKQYETTGMVRFGYKLEDGRTGQLNRSRLSVVAVVEFGRANELPPAFEG